MMRRALLSALAAICATGLAQAAEAPPDQPLTLAEAQRLALVNHPAVHRQDLEVAAAKEEVRAARSGYLPQVLGFANRVFAPNNTRLAAINGLNDPTVIDRGSIGVGVSQLITDFGKTSAEVASADYARQAEAGEATLTRESAVLNASRAYYRTLRAHALLRVAEATVKERQDLLKRVRAMRDAKLKSDLDVGISQQVVDQANLLLHAATGDDDDAMAELSEALGYERTRRFVLADIDDGNVAPPPADVGPLLDAAINANPELAARKAAHEAAIKEADAAGDARLPTVSAMGYLGYSPLANPDQRLRSSDSAVGVVLSVPLFTGGLLEANEAQAHDKALAADEVVDETLNTLTRDVRVAYDHSHTAFDDIAVTDHLLKIAGKSLELTRAGFDLGRNSIVDLSQAELALTQAQIAHAEARYRYLAELAQLQFETGQLPAGTEPAG